MLKNVLKNKPLIYVLQLRLYQLSMLRKEIYLRQLHAQLKELMQSPARAYLTIDDRNNVFYFSANCLLGFANELVTAIINKKEKTQLDYTYLIVALQITNQSYHQHVSQFKLAYPNINHFQTINRLVQYFTNNAPLKSLGQTKQSIRRKYQKSIGKAEFQGYFRIPQVPVFLVSTFWLQKFYSSDEINPGPVRNQMLLEPTQFPLSSQKYWHFNYLIRADVRQNQDFKIVPYQAWKLLFQTYGGVQARRYTTNEKTPTVQVWYSLVTFWIIQQRAILAKIQLQVTKSQSLQQTLQRLKLTLSKYKALPISYFSRSPTFYRIKELQSDQFTALLHSQAHNQILAQKMERIASLNIDFEELSLFSSRQALVVNFNIGNSAIFTQVPLLKVLQLKEKCLKCGSHQDIQLCKCKSVYFCSKKCRDDSQNHFRECDSIQSQARKYRAVTQYYDVKRRCYAKINDIIAVGKVGFQNLGNTCYMNAAIQCVMRLQPLMRYFLANQHLQDLNVSNVLGSEGYLACSFGQLVKSFYTSKQRSIEATAVLRIIARNAQFRGYNHQDSQQFLNYFLDKLHEDLNRVKVKPYTQQVQSNGRPDQVVSQLSWQNFRKRNFSMITDLLAGQYRSQIRCPDCQKISITFDPFLSLTLQFPRPQKGTTIQGFFMTDQGQFQKISVQVKPAMNTYQFYQKYFHFPVKGIQQAQKKIVYQWNHNLSLFQNKKDKGTVFFYEKPLGHAVQLQLQYQFNEKKEGQNFIRVAFVHGLINQQELLDLLYKTIRKPIQKALSKDLGIEGYLSMCRQRSFIKIISISKNPNSEPLFPIVGSTIVKVTAHIDSVKLQSSNVKLNVQSGIYEGKIQSFIRKVGNVLTIQELIHCFSQPERLTQENAWYCSVCKDHKLADKAMQIFRLPQYLIVHLKRFNHSGNRFVIYGQKVNTAIALEQFQIIKGKKYELIGMVNHIGTLMHGHYTAIVKRDGWYNYDDSRCSKTQVDGRSAYLLFYQLAQ